MKTFKARLLTVAPVKSALPPPGLPEIAVVGRSNAGKSSLINSLVGQKSLARVSGQPGRTRALVFFEIDRRFLLVDLPGYGFARGSKTEQAGWGSLVDAYLGGDRPIAGVVCLFDIRRDPDELDQALAGLLGHHHRVWQAVWTKADKLTNRQRSQRTRELDQSLSLSAPGIPYSSTRHFGRDDLIDWIESRLASV